MKTLIEKKSGVRKDIEGMMSVLKDIGREEKSVENMVSQYLKDLHDIRTTVDGRDVPLSPCMKLWVMRIVLSWLYHVYAPMTKDEKTRRRLRRYKDMAGGDPSNLITDLFNNMYHFWSLGYQPIFDYCPEPFQTFRSVMNDLSRLENEYVRMRRGFISDKEVSEDDKIILEFPDGSGWFLLPRPSCDVEAAAMGHCGNSPNAHREGTKILSYRTPKKGGWEPHLTFIINSKGYLGERKGYANTKPKRKYHPYIVQLLKLPMIRGMWYDGIAYKKEVDFHLDDLDEEMFGDLLFGGYMKDWVFDKDNFEHLHRAMEKLGIEALHQLPSDSGLYPSLAKALIVGDEGLIESMVPKIEDPKLVDHVVRSGAVDVKRLLDEGNNEAVSKVLTAYLGSGYGEIDFDPEIDGFVIERYDDIFHMLSSITGDDVFEFIELLNMFRHYLEETFDETRLGERIDEVLSEMRRIDPEKYEDIVRPFTDVDGNVDERRRFKFVMLVGQLLEDVLIEQLSEREVAEMLRREIGGVMLDISHGGEVLLDTNMDPFTLETVVSMNRETVVDFLALVREEMMEPEDMSFRLKLVHVPELEHLAEITVGRLADEIVNDNEAMLDIISRAAYYVS